MVDKVQLKSQGCETFLFHHGLVKLIVLHELKRVKKYWSSFVFVCDFGTKKQGEGTSSGVKETSSAEVSRSAMTREKGMQN